MLKTDWKWTGRFLALVLALQAPVTLALSCTGHASHSVEREATHVEMEQVNSLDAKCRKAEPANRASGQPTPQHDHNHMSADHQSDACCDSMCLCPQAAPTVLPGEIADRAPDDYAVMIATTPQFKISLSPSSITHPPSL